MAYEDERYLFEIRLLINHPSIDPTVITQELGREPNYSWRVGSPRKFSYGTPRPGVYEGSMWNHTVVVEG
jgi:hypothetical protein